MLRILYFLAFVFSAKSASAPFIKPCKKGDSACVMKSAKAALPTFVAGIPDLGVKTLDPLQLALISSDERGLKVKLIDSVLTGLKDCTLENVKNDMDKMKQTVEVNCNMVLKGNYTLSGQLLILPVQGEGKYKIDIKDIVIKVVGDIATNTGEDGKQHWHISKWKHNYNVKKNVRFTFENLFNGNKALAEPVIEFANNNWKDVMQEIAPPIVRAIVSEVVDALEALYKAVPAEELYVA
ncbi:circadian clock-controlled protein daywake-like [Epargyreus clarus]|uniref:circadian clock-controlled protein daywake-like n=1 Tax=Epargyreus clarus TaxID=520877 RepID=UPI003C30DBAE